jgi:rSAM/selenodomain-associated transferase 2
MNLAPKVIKSHNSFSSVTPPLSSSTKISIIIPTLNESLIIEKCLSHLHHLANTEIIFVDGGSKDSTIELIKNAGFNIIISPLTGRSHQMNLGAKYATGEILLFLHADTFLPLNYSTLVTNILTQSKTIVGAFSLKIDSDKTIFRFLEVMINCRSHFLSLPYGDQGIFLKKSIFEQIGGFKEIPIMEDFELIKRLQKQGKIVIVDESVITSARRWQKLGVWKTTLINQLIILGYYLKIEPQKLANFYRQIKGRLG